jgi:hypothetical protein
MRRGSVYLSLTSHHTEAREALGGPAFAGFPYSWGSDLKLLDNAVEALQRLVERHELA